MHVTETIIIGAGPAGLFCAEELLKAGRRVLILDSGKNIGDRKCPRTEACDCRICDILEGGGGAGGFSDGKMTLSLGRGTQTEQIFDESSESILDEIDAKMTFYGGAGVYYEPVNEPPQGFLDAGFRFDSYPLRHFGSDGAQQMIAAQIEWLSRYGVEFRFNCMVENLICNEAGEVNGVQLADQTEILADQVVVATGLQGTPWLEGQATRLGIQLLSGPAGFGMRIETDAGDLAEIFEAFYDFKLELDCPIGTLRSFCCNREGYIVNENHRTLMIRNVNGHSNLAPQLRSKSSNFAIIAKIEPEITHPLSPQTWVRQVARRLSLLNRGRTASQYAMDFIAECPSISEDLEANPIRTNAQSSTDFEISAHLPKALYESFRKFLIAVNESLPGGFSTDSVVYAPEIKYYASRFPVDMNWASLDVRGLYVVGNASGYLDSYVAAAVSGMIAARDIIKHYEVK